METNLCDTLESLTENNVDTIVLALPSQEIDVQPSNSSLVRSECGQLYLVTYDENNKIISKHQINLQVSTDDLLELKCENISDTAASAVRGVAQNGHLTQVEQSEVASEFNDIDTEDRSQSGKVMPKCSVCQ